MTNLATTKMSSKGQVVIPEQIRQALGLTAGAQFIVLSDHDVVILKTITPPSFKDFGSLVARARIQAKKAGLKKKDIETLIKKVRKQK